MAIRIPSNQIIYNYTSGGEYTVKTTYEDYQGYYYTLNGNTYAGRSFDINNPMLVSTMTLPSRTDPIKIYEAVSKIDLSTFLKENLNITSIDFGSTAKSDEAIERHVSRYFVKSAKDNIVKETTEDIYNKVQNNPIYQTYTVKFIYSMNDKEIDQIEKIFPGIKPFLSIFPVTSEDETPQNSTTNNVNI